MRRAPKAAAMRVRDELGEVNSRCCSEFTAVGDISYLRELTGFKAGKKMVLKRELYDSIAGFFLYNVRDPLKFCDAHILCVCAEASRT